MAQNTSHAVMAQRIEPHDSLDFFPTPPWATRALCEWIAGHGSTVAMMKAWDPACGEGHMSRPLAEYFETVKASDIAPYNGAGTVQDFLFSDYCTADWIITNPPFRLAERFAAHAFKLSQRGVALLVRTSFLEGQERFRELFDVSPPTDILQFTERVPMHKGRLEKSGSTATAYCWLVWHKRNFPGRTEFHWIAPCRKRLEKDTDYTGAE